MSSEAPQQNAAGQAPVKVPIVPLPDNEEIEAEDEVDSVFGSSEGSAMKDNLMVDFSSIDSILALTPRSTWPFDKKFDLVHVRLMLGAFTEEECTSLLRHVYDDLASGAWFEHVDSHIEIDCNDGTMLRDSILADFHKTLDNPVEASGRVMFVTDRMVERIKAAGFTNIHEKNFKPPTGGWAKHPI